MSDAQPTPSPVSVLDAVAEPLTAALTAAAQRQMRLSALNDRVLAAKRKYAEVLTEVASVKADFDAEMAAA